MAQHKDLVILLPGITGSVLASKSGKDVWAPSLGVAWRALTSLGKSITGLELAADDADDGVVATRLVPDVSIVPGLIKLDGYTRIAESLCKRLELEEGKNFRAFPYDWRRDNRRTAAMLESQAMDWLARWRAESGNPKAKLVLVGHSMGGLISRWFVECLGGWQHTRALVTLGTPHRGALNAVGFIENGMKKGIGPFGLDLSPLLRSFTSVYQLLPIYPCIDAGGPTQRVADAARAGLLTHTDAERATAARAFHQQIIDAQAANAKTDAYVNSGYTMVPIVGTEQPTAQSAQVANGRCTLVNSLGGQDLAGDGTVPRASATPVDMEGAKREVYAAESHGSIQNNDGTLANLVGLLTADQIDWRKFQRAADLTSLTLDLADDVLLPDESLQVRARASEGSPKLNARLQSLADGTDVDEPLQRDSTRGEGWMAGEFKLPPGTWRVTVHGSGVAPVSDLVVVAEA
jgi:pimeloyl-ACP methyl ester carboxylesterase